jgi:GntR family transcriptional repressor for pyruvate dehydrogenase complex
MISDRQGVSSAVTAEEAHRSGDPPLPARGQGIPVAASQRVTVTRRVVDALLGMLSSGEYKVGDRLPSEWELVRQLSVGRSAVREAMRELVTLDLVELRRGRGTYVRSLRSDLLLRPETFAGSVESAVRHELLEVRQIVEPEAAALAAIRATATEVDRLDHDVDCLRGAVNTGFRPPEDLGFHLDVVRATHNGSLARVTAAIVSYYARDDALPTDRDVQEHQAIAAAIRDRDAASARAAMLDHLTAENTLKP